MSASTAFDIRYPIGGLFLALGALLLLYGVYVQSATTALSANIDVWWGVVMFVFGALFLTLARAADLRHARGLAHVEPPAKEP